MVVDKKSKKKLFSRFCEKIRFIFWENEIFFYQRSWAKNRTKLIFETSCGFFAFFAPVLEPLLLGPPDPGLRLPVLWSRSGPFWPGP